MKYLVIPALLLLPSLAHAQSMGTLTAVPTHPVAPTTPAIVLSWGPVPPPGPNTVMRWTDANPTPVTLATTASGVAGYTDTTALANTIYYYQVMNINYGSTTIGIGAISDTTMPFNCPPPGQAANLGMDRTEAFTATDGTPVSFTVHVPLPMPAVIDITPCNGATGCDDYTNINNAIQTIGNGGGGTVNLAAGDYYVDSKCTIGMYCPNIPILSPGGMPWNDITLAGAALDMTNVPTTHIHLGNSTQNNPAGLVIGVINRTLVKNITLDQDRPNAIPGTVHSVTDASFTGTIGSVTSLNATLTVTAVNSGAIVPGTSFLYDPAGQIGTLAQIINQISGPAGGAGTYTLQNSAGTPINAIASPIPMTSVSSQRFYVKTGDEAYYVPNPASPPAPIHLDGYNWVNRTYDLRGGSRIAINAGTFNPNFNATGNPDQGQYFWTLAGGRNLPDGEQGIMFIRSGSTVNVGVVATNTTLENVHVYGGGATGLLVPARSQNLRVSNFKITHTPDSLLRPGELQRYVSLIGDSEENNAWGNVVIENSEMGFVDDDSFYVRGPAGPLSTIISTSEFTIWKTFQIIPYPTGDTFKLIDPATYATIGAGPGSLTNVTCVPDIPPGTNPTQCAALSQTTGYVWDITMAAPMPALAPYIGLMGPPTNPGVPYQTPILGLPQQSGANLIIRNSCFHDNHGRIFPMANNILLQNNIFANSFYGPIELSINQANPGAAKPDGPGSWNVTITGNKLLGSMAGFTDLATVWSPLAVTNGFPQTGWLAGTINIYAIGNTGFFAAGYPMTNIQITNNFISNSPGLAISVNSVANASVTGNTVVDANRVPFAANFNANFCGSKSQGSQPSGANQPWCLAKIAAQGSIMVTNSKNIDYSSTPNTFLGTTSITPGIYNDPASTTYDTLVGSHFVH